ncbi:NAD(P)-binding protein [Viridothelium virens]|uniref:NAD(P)-binding protein n=1 Tax=Viridothelium virens TaxID=1048519 RepID=A0A6A6GWA2_VIRVR|nr:NAD(P)-binding protein [Viridothelium virens]
MSILITGAGGFVGQGLAAALLTSSSPPPSLILTDVTEPPMPSLPPDLQHHVRRLSADLTDTQSRQSLLSSAASNHDLRAVYLLHGIMSSGAEANLNLGLSVNLDSTRALLDDLRSQHPGIRVVYTSSCAVYGPQPEGTLFSEDATVSVPLSSYGTEKLMCEFLLSDYSRRGLLDGVVCRLPTVIVRPGKPTAAASSFASGIIREPLAGKEALLPVRRELKLWNCSAKVVVRNLVYAGEIDTKRFAEKGYLNRVVNLPGRTMTVQQMLDALERVGGKEVRDRVKEERDEVIEKIVYGWAVAYDTKRARELGFTEEQELEQTVRDYVEGYVNK